METTLSVADQVIELFRSKGNGLYFGEQVTETQHALQAAHLAVLAGASDNLIVGALLHDIGHLLHDLGEDAADHGIDAKHEDLGAAWMQGVFPEEVIACVRLHVGAKRYLTAREPGYLEGLSPASLESLRLQGGPFTDAEADDFETREPWFASALQVRRWDDEAKIVGLAVPPLEHYRDIIARVILVSPA